MIYGKPFLLLPDVVLMLTAQGTDEGSASVSLPHHFRGRACKVIEPWEPNQAQTAFSRMAVKKGEAVYHCYIDVFAETSGHLTWDKELVVGRSLTTQHLFIKDKDSKHTRQYFNQGDWMLDARSWDEPFDWRATPPLRAERAPWAEEAASQHEARELFRDEDPRAETALQKARTPAPVSPAHAGSAEPGALHTPRLQRQSALLFSARGASDPSSPGPGLENLGDCDLDFRHTCVPARWRSP